MKNVLLYLWQLPQNLLGLTVIFFSKAKKKNWQNVTYFATKHNFGVSLGNYIIIRESSEYKDLFHEYGHQKQSNYLGWLYLPIIGIWSGVFVNLYDRLFHRKWTLWKRYIWYYSQFPERWADKLGKVNR